MGFAVPVHPEQSQNVADCLAFRGPETFLRICSASTVDEVPCIGRADRLSVEIKQVEKKVDEGIDVARIGRGLDHAERGCAVRPNAAQLTVEIRLRGGADADIGPRRRTSQIHRVCHARVMPEKGIWAAHASSPRVVHLREALHSAAAELDPRLCVVAIDLHRGLQP